MIAFARAKGYEIFTHPDRLIFSDDRLVAARIVSMARRSHAMRISCQPVRSRKAVLERPPTCGKAGVAYTHSQKG